MRVEAKDKIKITMGNVASVGQTAQVNTEEIKPETSE